MAEKINSYYRAMWHSEGIIGPILTKKQLMNELEASLLSISNNNPQLSLSISKVDMTESQFKNRSEEMKNYTYAGIEQ